MSDTRGGDAAGIGSEGGEQDGLLVRGARQLEHARNTVRRARRSLLSASGIRGTAVEAAWVGAHLVMYPFHAATGSTMEFESRTQLQDLPPVQRGLLVGDVEAAGTPIVLVHGIVDNRSVFTLLRRALRRRGFGRLASFNYSSLTGDLRQVAQRLGDMVEQVCEDTGYERVHVVGHSMGGLVARYYVQRLGGDARVHTLVTMGTPHEGTTPAYALPHPLVRQMRPGSDVIRELAEPAAGCRTRFVAIWSDLDQMISPKQSGKIVHPDLSARNVFLRGVGHMSFPVDGRVLHEIGTTLAHLDLHGHTVVTGATSIASSTGRTTRARAAASAGDSALGLAASDPIR